MKKGTCSENDYRIVLQHPLSSEFVRLGCWAGIDKKMNTGCSLISKRWGPTGEKTKWRWHWVWSRLHSKIQSFYTTCMDDCVYSYHCLWNPLYFILMVVLDVPVYIEGSGLTTTICKSFVLPPTALHLDGSFCLNVPLDKCS